VIRPFEEKYPNSGVALHWIAKVYAILEDEAETVKWLERSAGPARVAVFWRLR
jgi:hypothetical protein